MKGKAFFQSKSDKNSGKGRENREITEKTVLFISLTMTKIPIRAEKEGREHGIDIRRRG